MKAFLQKITQRKTSLPPVEKKLLLHHASGSTLQLPQTSQIQKASLEETTSDAYNLTLHVSDSRKFAEQLRLVRFPMHLAEPPEVFLGKNIPELDICHTHHKVQFQLPMGRTRGTFQTKHYAWLIQLGDNLDDYQGTLKIRYL